MSEPDSTWQVLIQRRAEKELRRLDKPIRQRIRQAINQLVINSRPSGCKKLAATTTCIACGLATGGFPTPLKRTN